MYLCISTTLNLNFSVKLIYKPWQCDFHYEIWPTYDHLTLHFTSTMASETEWGFLGILRPSHWDCHGPPLKLEEESPATVAAPPAKNTQRVLADLRFSDMSLNQKKHGGTTNMCIYIYIYMCVKDLWLDLVSSVTASLKGTCLLISDFVGADLLVFDSAAPIHALLWCSTTGCNW